MLVGRETGLEIAAQRLNRHVQTSETPLEATFLALPDNGVPECEPPDFTESTHSAIIFVKIMISPELAHIITISLRVVQKPSGRTTHFSTSPRWVCKVALVRRTIRLGCFSSRYTLKPNYGFDY